MHKIRVSNGEKGSEGMHKMRMRVVGTMSVCGW